MELSLGQVSNNGGIELLSEVQTDRQIFNKLAGDATPLALTAGDMQKDNAIYLSQDGKVQLILRRVDRGRIEMTTKLLEDAGINAFLPLSAVEGSDDYCYATADTGTINVARLQLYENRPVRDYIGAIEILDKIVELIAMLHKAQLSIPGVALEDFVVGGSGDNIIRLLKIEKVAHRNTDEENDLESLIESVKSNDHNKDHTQQIEKISARYRELMK